MQTSANEPPEILEKLKSSVILEGDTIVFTSLIVGNPTPKITWLKDNSSITKGQSRVNGNLYTLTLLNTSPTDSGLYCVKAKNKIGSAESSATLIVERKSLFIFLTVNN